MANSKSTSDISKNDRSIIENEKIYWEQKNDFE